MLPRTLLPLVALAVVALPAQASATEVGGVAPSGLNEICAIDAAESVIGAGAASTIPADGVVTSFRTAHAGEAGVPFLFRVFRPSGSGFASVARIPAEVGADLGASAPARVAVHAGDRLGLSKTRGNELGCMFAGTQSSDAVVKTAFDDPGGPIPLGVKLDGVLPNVAATLEPDADGDGFGDETQDGCPADAARQGECAPPPPPEPPPAPAPPVPSPAVVAPAAVPPPAAAPCRVPRLRGLTLRAAKRRLAAAGCRTGKVRRGRGARLRVRRQSVRPGRTVTAGTRVALVLRA
ncbi:MAG TPA: PASTA domain-containing protein [Solirubrobacteraceae bacterium]|jgi:hypothetical protein